MNTDTLKDTIRRELPAWLREDPVFRADILELTRQEYADRRDTDERFYRLLGDLRRDREEQNRKWEENRVELEQRRQDDLRKWEANQAELKGLHEEVMAIARKHERSIGALGSRWRLQSERSFRNALAAILEKSFDVQVRTVTEWDEAGEVFGRPDQVELDVIIHNGLLILCELKSSIDKAGMYSFERKARFYERRHDRRADRLIVISPMIDPRAAPVADRLGIETYGDSLDVETLL